MGELACQEFEEAVQLGRVPPERRRKLRRVRFRGRLERAHVHLKPVAEPLDPAEHADGVALAETPLEQLDVRPDARLDPAARIDELERQIRCPSPRPSALLARDRVDALDDPVLGEGGDGAHDAILGPKADAIARSPGWRWRCDAGRDSVANTPPDNEAEADRLWRDWRAGGILVDEDEPGYWWLSQDYVGPDGVARTREGLVASLRAEPYERRVVLPHERTHRGPKEDRLRLLRAVRAQLEPLFFLYEGQPPARRPVRQPDLETDGVRLWRLPPDGIAKAFADRQLLIADGHHRYETALAYHEEAGTPESAYLLAVLVSLDDPGLMIFPTHRLLQGVNGPRPTHDDVNLAMLDLAKQPADRARGVLYRRNHRIAMLYGDEGQLDVELTDALQPQGVSYTASLEEAVTAVERGDAEAALLVRPTRIQDVYARAREGRVMPQKTTYFYTKLVSGLLFLPF